MTLKGMTAKEALCKQSAPSRKPKGKKEAFSNIQLLQESTLIQGSLWMQENEAEPDILWASIASVNIEESKSLEFHAMSCSIIWAKYETASTTSLEVECVAHPSHE